MVDVIPFRALRPRDDLAAEVIAPPYDVLSEAEAREIAKNRRSFVRVTRSEVDLPEGTDSHSDEAYNMARANLDKFVADGILVEDADPHYYFYGQQMGEHRQTGILAAASAPEYDQGLIKKHEYTRPDKEDDRTHHMDVLDAQVGLVFLTYRASADIQKITDEVTAGEPAWKVTTDDGVEHALWPAPVAHNDALKAAFAGVDALYVADGHHRSAAASRIHEKRKDERSEHFLVGLFPDDALMVLAYNRVVHDLNGLDADAFVAKVKEKFDLADGQPKPERAGQLSMYLEGKWYFLTPKAGVVDESDPVARLDVAVLQDHVLAPILGIEDPRRSTRITFVGGIRGPEALSKAVDGGAAVAFHMWPTPLDQLFAVADAGQVMPPKSTWFEPKLREGVVVRKL
jgi:uncharacterized protein (DUF1015 family)